MLPLDLQSHSRHSDGELEVPELDGETRALIDVHLPSYGTSQNPVDLTAQAVKGIDEGWIVAVVQQDPYQEGVAGVESILKLKKGETVPASIDIPVTIVTKQNVDKFRSMFK